VVVGVPRTMRGLHILLPLKATGVLPVVIKYCLQLIDRVSESSTGSNSAMPETVCRGRRESNVSALEPA
jgi:hypothetical protein